MDLEGNLGFLREAIPAYQQSKQTKPKNLDRVWLMWACLTKLKDDFEAEDDLRRDTAIKGTSQIRVEMHAKDRAGDSWSR